MVRSSNLLVLAGVLACTGQARDSALATTSGSPTTLTGAGTGSPTTGATTSTSTTTGSTSTTSTSTTTTTEPTGCASGPLAAPIPGCAPAPLPATGDFGQDCVDRINQLRWECQCLPPLQRWTDAEACTEQQVADDQLTATPHGHFGSCGEFGQNTCTHMGSDTDVLNYCLQAMWDQGPGPGPQIDHGYYLNMASQSFTRVACGRTVGDVWSNQNFQ